MAVVMIEGFDHLVAGDFTLKGWSGGFSSMQPGRFDGQCGRTTSATVRAKLLPSTYSTLFAGFALRFATASTNSFFYLRAGATIVAQIQLNGSSQIVVKNSGGTTIATGTTVLATNTWYYIELKIVVSGASGSCEVHLNGATEITSTTGNFGSSNIDTVANNAITTGNTDFDDMYVCDTSGSSPRNTFLGDVRVETIYPTADGAHTDWTPNSGSNQFSRVDEAQADGDTTYVSDSTPGHIDSFAMGDIDTGATVYGLQTNLYARKDDANTRQIADLVRQSGSDTVGTTVTLASTYLVYSQIHNQDPSAADWTPTTVNADEFGVKEVA